MTRPRSSGRLMVLTTGVLFASAIALVAARQQTSVAAAQEETSRVAIDDDDVGGVVTSASGREAGVWVIAETNDLPTTFRKIVVTDDRGRYLVPDLPKATYRVWVRGYGLVDSQPVQATPGQHLALTAVVARNARAAAQYYPSDYWYSLLRVPPKDAFPMAPESAVPGRGRGAPQGIASQAEWVSTIKGCVICHQMGDKATRELPASLGTFDSSIAAWDRRVNVGQNAASGINGVNRLGHERSLALFADWTDRIKAGEIPPAPSRPQGLERNLVVTQWDFGNTTSFLHDVMTTDKNVPTVNAYGSVWGLDWSHNSLEVLDPVKHTNATLKVPLKDERDRKILRAQVAPQLKMQAPSPYWGEELIWEEILGMTVTQLDSHGNVWYNAINKAGGTPDWCKAGSNNPYAKIWPLEVPPPNPEAPRASPTSMRAVNYYDPKTGKFGFVDTCFTTHHIQVAGDPDETIFGSGGGILSWVNSKVFLETGDSEKAQGWCAAIIDYNGDGKIGAFTRPPEPAEPGLDRQVQIGGYGVSWNPVDGSVWIASGSGVPGTIARIQRGAHPPSTCRTEVYAPPYNNPKLPGVMAATPRGIDVDRNGIVWTALATTGQLASFDRRKCKVLNGPTATGQHCPEGWTLYPTPGLKFQGVAATDQLNSDFLYYNWVDRFDTFGLGANTPIATGTGSDSLQVLDPTTHKWVTLRVPYPLGFFTRGLDGRIDDPKAGWKGRGLWGANEVRGVWHQETGKGSTSYAAHFQLRPDPLAK